MITIQDHPMVFGMIVTMILATAAIVHMAVGEIRSRRLNAHVDRALANEFTTPRSPLTGLFGSLRWIGEWARRFYAPNNLEYLRGVIQASGFNSHKMLPILLGAKLALTMIILTVAIVIAYFTGTVRHQIVVAGVGFMLSIVIPEWILGFVRSRFKAAVERGTPDSLDLLVVCSEAGMGLESALERVAQEMRHSNRPMSSVLFGLLDDLRVLPNHRDAFANLGSRSGVDGLRRFGTMLSQSMQYGTPLSDVLRAVAEELRRDRMNKLEEKAVKLPAKLIFPLIGFIMPSLYIVLLGPSFMHLYDTLGSIISH
jgi:tight adherence protein C